MTKQIISDKGNMLNPSTTGDSIFSHDSIDVILKISMVLGIFAIYIYDMITILSRSQYYNRECNSSAAGNNKVFTSTL